MILVTGAAGFIGFHLSQALLNAGFKVVGIDNMNDYYDVTLKEKRLSILKKNKKFEFHKLDICDFEKLKKVFDGVEIAIHLAAQAGVRYSIENPHAYIKSNIEGHLNILECCRNSKKLKKLIYASSSSVYGGNEKTPFSIKDRVDNPVSLYAATKRADELLSEAYNHLYKIPMIGLRFFTVYGEYGRPDMAPYKFTNAIMSGKQIEVFNNGNMKRDFTYVGDIIDGILGAMKFDIRNAHKIYNLGNNEPAELMKFISILELEIGKSAKIKFKPMQEGDVLETYADIVESTKDLGFKPKTSLEDGIAKLVKWHKALAKSL